MKPLISIVVPMYNVEKYIRECIKSLINQTYKEIEIVIIDDCTPDNCGTIALEYQARDPRIKYIKHDQNQGRLQARKTGIANATGTYILQVDADDMIYPELCEKIAELTKQNPDCITYNIECLQDDRFFINAKNNMNLKDYEGLDFFYALVKGEIWTGGSVQKIYKKEILDKAMDLIAHIKKMNMGEDILINFHSAIHVRKVLYLDYVGYTYRIHSGSITQQKITPAKIVADFTDLVVVCDSTEELFVNHNLDLSIVDNLRLHFFREYIKAYKHIINQQDRKYRQEFGAMIPSFILMRYITELLSDNMLLNDHEIFRDKWYLFGQLSKKQKLKKIITVVAKKLKIYSVYNKVLRAMKNKLR